jgi:hypothetical protein
MAGMDIERHNYAQIERLNQRGGRTLSIVDLVRAGTLNVEMAAAAMRSLSQGASLLTGARPGGAGKTTLMAALLNLMPPEIPIATVEDRTVLDRALASPAEPSCYLAHEIGSGDWYGYLWGSDVARFLTLIDGPRRVASCLHADTLDELVAMLTGRPLNVPRATVSRVGLMLFMHVSPAPRAYRRRVATFYESDGAGNHRLRYRWDAASDSFSRQPSGEDPEALAPYVDFLTELVDRGETDGRAVRRRVLDFYRSASS